MIQPTQAAVLLGRIAGGDERALAELVEACGPVVLSTAMKVLKVWHDAEEVAQNVWCEVWRNAGKFEESKGSAVAWICCIARRRAIDAMRSAGSYARMLEVVSALPEPEAEPPHGLEEFLAVLDKTVPLTPAQRTVWELVVMRGMSQREAGDFLGCGRGTVTTRVEGMRKTLTRYASELRGDPQVGRHAPPVGGKCTQRTCRNPRDNDLSLKAWTGLLG